MENLKLHSFGQNDHRESLKEKYTALRRKVKANETLTESEKKAELKNLTALFEKEKRDSRNNLY